MADLLERLMALELAEPETSTVTITRLDLVLPVKELTYRQVKACRREEDADANFMLAACPTLRSPDWWEDRLGCATPVEAVRRVFRPGEIEAVVREIARLSGYGTGQVIRGDESVLEEVAIAGVLEELEKN